MGRGNKYSILASAIRSALKGAGECVRSGWRGPTSLLCLRLSAAVAALFLLSSCEIRDIQTEQRAYRVDETHIQVSRDRNEVFWLDAKTVVFNGIDNGAPPEDAFQAPSQIAFNNKPSHIYIWVLNQEPRALSVDHWSDTVAERLRQNLCAANGNIYYASSPHPNDGELRLWDNVTGPSARERSRRYYLGSGHHRWHPLVVGVFDHSKVNRRCEQVFAPELSEHNWLPSWRGDLIFDLGSTTVRLVPGRQLGPDGYYPLVIRKVGANAVIPIRGIAPPDIWPACGYALMWENSVVAWKCPPDGGAVPETVPVWKIHADGSTERTMLNLHRIVTRGLYPFRDGYFAEVSGTWDDDGQVDLTTSGIYVLVGNNWKKVLDEHYELRAISPNGCLAAFAVFYRDNENILPHLAIYDLCRAARS
jgi:hypothetical protein